MHVDVIEAFDALMGVRGDWEAVYAADPEASLFMSWRWMADWLAARPTVWLVLAAKESPTDDRYVAFLPLRMRVHFDKERGFVNELYLAGGGYADYAGLLARPDVEAAAISAFTDHLRKKLNWAKLTLENLRMSDRRRRLFLSAFDERRFVHKDIDYVDKVAGTDHSICPSIALPSDWDAYLETLSANNRQKIRRWLRKVEASEDYEITLSDSETYARDIDMLMGLWKSKWGRRKGARTDDLVRCNRAMLTRAARNGTLFLPIFRHAGRPVAALAILVDPVKKAMLFVITGRDESYDEAPAGYLLHAFSIRHAIAQGLATYDFLRGDEPYKYLFASGGDRLRACSVATRNGENLGGALDPRCLERMRDMALNLEKKSEIAAAERAYRQILTMRPDDALTLYRLGRLLAARAEHAEAARLLTRSTAIDPDGDNAWLKLAHSLHALGDDAAALAACRQVVRLKPTNEEAKRLIVHLALAGRRGPAVVFGAEDSPAPTWNQLSAAAWSLPRPAVALARP